MEIEKLAEITAQEFSTIHEKIDTLGVELKANIADLKVQMNSNQKHLESALKNVLEAVLDVPSKKIIDKIVHKTEDIDDRLASVERKLRTA